MEKAIQLAKLGRGSLVGSLFTANDNTARDVALGVAAVSRAAADTQPAQRQVVHRPRIAAPAAGARWSGASRGWEEMGGIRGVLHYMQRTAVQGSPTTLTTYHPTSGARGRAAASDRDPPVPQVLTTSCRSARDALITHRRTVTEADIVNFAGNERRYILCPCGRHSG